MLADRFDEVLAVDISAPLIEIARRRRPHPRVCYQVRDLLTVEEPPFDLVLSTATLHHLPDLEAALSHLRGLVAGRGAAILADVVSSWTPPRWAYLAGAWRNFPADVLGLGWRSASWLRRFRTCPEWLDHLAGDSYLTRAAFEERYGAQFAGGRFVQLGNLHALIWRRAG